MTYSNYKQALELSYEPSMPVQALIMAAMIIAGTDDLPKLTRAFPNIWSELKARDDAPGGKLMGEDASYLK